MSGVEPNDDVSKLIAERMMRVQDVRPPEGHSYYVIEAQTAASERAGLFWMPGTEGGVPVFQSRELATEALQFIPPPQVFGLDEAAVGWGVQPLPAEEFLSLFINPSLTFYVVLKVSDSGMEAQPLTDPRRVLPIASPPGASGLPRSSLESAPTQTTEGDLANLETRLTRASVEGLSPGERLWKLMEPAFDHDAMRGTHG
ncbi:hypothetical protein [Myxococcus landrumensis]|uniref:Type III secretion system (T3SS) SseB-like protein n=1 Tax=Myxococcus landrumensis TaxID=2813577 RepID=A0ABX7NF78_9BACT|nr:hypothetical protein [Myxococcus landrumus]QSQ17472.1 hypothetical protein JY572_16125 [Myxococcus landrumus]